MHVRFQARNQGQIWKFWTQFLGSGRAWERKKGERNFNGKKNGESGRVGEKTPTKKPKRFLVSYVCAWSAMRCAGNWRENFEVFGL